MEERRKKLHRIKYHIGNNNEQVPAYTYVDRNRFEFLIKIIHFVYPH